MAWPQGPLDMQAELYAGGWQDISGYVRLADRVRIEHGQSPGQSDGTEPSRCSLTLDNRDARFSPKNPVGPYYGRLGRNTPLRVSVGVVRDDFGRTTANGWGSADTGQAWSTGGAGGTVAASDYGVSGGVGWHSVPVSDASRFTYLAGELYRDVDVTADFRLPLSNVTGGSAQGSILFRGRSATEFYRARAWISSTEAVTLEIGDLTGLTIAGPLFLGSFPALDSVPLRLRVQVEGTSARAKAWSSDGPEPLDWQVTAQTPATDAGWVGLRSFVDAPNTNTKPYVIRYDNVAIRLPQFSGSVPEWPPEWAPSEATVWTRVEALGTLGRLRQDRTPEQSALRRYIPTTNPFAYWPMDDGPLALMATPVVGKTLIRLYSSVTDQSRQWGQGDLAPWLERGLLRLGLATVTSDNFTMPGFAGKWVIDHIRAGGRIYNGMYIRTTSTEWTVDFGLSANQVRVNFNGATSSTTYPKLFDGAAHHVRLFASTAQASNISWTLYVDGINVLSGAPQGTPLEPMRYIDFQNLQEPTADSPIAMGHVAIWIANEPPLADVVKAAFGHQGETAGRRIERICAEEGIDFIALGDLYDTQPLGPQPLGPPLTVLESSAASDAGYLHDARGADLAYRPGRSVYNQAVDLTLDYRTRGHVAPPLRPVEPHLVDAVTVTRRYASTLLTAGEAGGRSQTLTADVRTDAQAAHLRDWLLRIGTWDEARYADVPINQLALAGASGGLALAITAASLGLYDRLAVTNPPAWCGPTSIDQLASGISAVIGEIDWTLAFTTTPAGPWDVWEIEHATYGRLHLDGQAVATSVASNAGTLSVTTAAGKPLLTTDPADLPMRIRVAGAELDVTAVSGGASPQTATTTLVNGVVKTLPAGSVIELASQHAVAY